MRVAAPGIRLLEVAACALALLFGWRLFTLQVLDHERFLGLAVQQWQKEQPLPAPRGSLFDRAGTPLAVGTLHYKVTADPEAFQKRAVRERQAILSLIAGQLGQSESWLRRKLGGKGRYALLHDGLALGLEDRERLRATGVVHLEACSRRLYPMGALAAPLIGFVNDEDAGVCGLEAGLQGELAGQPGRELVQKDDRGQVLISPLNRVLVEPQRGRDVYLTLDHKAQAIADIELARAAADCGARAGAVVILDPGRGEILALSSWPAVAERDEARFDPTEWKLLPVQALYEPGSTLKAITSAALLERGQVTLTTQTDAEDGSATVDGFPVRDDKAHPGYLTFREAFALSSNICFAKLSRRLSNEDLYRTLQDCGFGNAYGLELPGEENGILRRPAEWSGRSKLTLIYGQEISATPLQITAAVGAIANRGLLMKPRLLRGSSDGEGRDLREDGPVLLRRVCKEETAATLLALLGEVVENGTGKSARVPGLPVGGKTGTAQKFEGGRVKAGKYLASFVGVAPLAEPRVVIGVYLDEPRAGLTHGGQSAAPAFARIVEKLAVATPYLFQPSAQAPAAAAAEGRPVPSFLELELTRAQDLARAEGLSLLLRGRGRRVVAQQPDPGCRQRLDSPVQLVLGDPPASTGAAPELLGLSLREARRRALERGFAIVPEGVGVVLAQGLPDSSRGGAIPLWLGAPGEEPPAAAKGDSTAALMKVAALPVAPASSARTAIPAATSASKPAKRPAAKAVARPAARSASKPAAKPRVKPAAKPAAKPGTWVEVKPAIKPAAKPAAKPASKSATKPAAKPAAKPGTKPAPKPGAKCAPGPRT